MIVGAALLLALVQGGALPADRDGFPRPADSVVSRNSIDDVQQALDFLREGERTGNRRPVDLALDILTAVERRHPHWPWPGYLMARGFLVLNRDRAMLLPTEGLDIGESYVEGAWRDLRESLEADPQFTPARRLAARLLLAEGERELRADERAVLNILAAGPTAEPDALIVLARDLRGRMKPDSADAALQRAMDAGADHSLVQLERARVRTAQGRTEEAGGAYWAGLQQLTPAGRQAYRFDLGWLIDADSLASFDRVADDSVAGWLARFWAERDAATANHPGERLAEQLRRWNAAVAQYRVAIPWRHTQFARTEYLFEGLDLCVASNAELYDLLGKAQAALPDDPRYREPLFDHRGLIFLRHGQPMRIVTGPGYGDVSPGAAPLDLTRHSSGAERMNQELADEMDLSMWQNEGWLYWFEGDWRVLNFRGSKALGTYAPTTLTSYLPVQNALNKLYFSDWQVRANLLPEYKAALSRLGRPTVAPKSCIREVKVVIDRGRDDSRVATHSDSDTPLIPDPWNAVLQFFALGSKAEENGKVLFSFAIPGAAMQITRPDSVHAIYDIDFRLVAYEPTTGQTIEVDSTRRYLVSDVLAHDQNISGWFELSLPAGKWQVAAKLGQEGRQAGAFSLARDLRIGNGSALSLSDVVPGRDDAPFWSAPDDVAFPLNVQGAWDERQSAEIYYEVRGVAADSNYRTTIEVRPVRAGDPGLVRIANSDRSTGGPQRVRRTIGLARLMPGAYTLTVTVTAGSESVSRSRLLLIAPSQGKMP